MHRIDLDAYLERIGHDGTTDPTSETLRALHYAHITTFVFENLDNWTGRHVSLDPAVIEDKFVRRRRGGYCFETNSLFAAVLGQLGFKLHPLIARVIWMQPPGTRTARSHHLLRVEIDGRPWIADVGFGGAGQTVPLLLEPGTVQETPHHPRRYVEDDHGVITQQVSFSPGQWEDLYAFDLHPAAQADFEMANWYISAHPDSLFRKTPLVTRVEDDRRLSFAFGEFTCRYLDGRTETRQVTDDADFRKMLVNDFGLPEDDPAVREASLSGPAPMPPLRV